MSDLSLYVVTHKKINTSDMAPCFVPIQAGSALHENLGYLADNTGDNISNLNKYIDECTALYWIWKNDNSSKYIGINHYRRFFGDDTESNPSKIASSDLLLKYLESYDIITLNPVSFPPLTVRQQFESFMDPDAFESGMSVVPKIIKKRHPEYFADYEQVFSMSEFYHCNMFVTSREIFSKYCEWLFDILIEACHQINIESYDNYSRRVIGFWAERLLSVWLHHNNYKIKTLPLIEKDLSQEQHVPQKEESLEEKKSVPKQKSEKVDAVLTETNRLLNSMEQGLLSWYNFKKSSKILYISKKPDSLVQYLNSLGCDVTVMSIAASSKISDKYDYVIAIDMLEKCREPVLMLSRWNALLNESGVLILGCQNRFGIKYFCGDVDPYTKNQFDGIEDYKNYGSNIVKDIGGRCYGYGELKSMLDSAGIEYNRFYSVMPNLNCPQLIYAEDFLPNEELANHYYAIYNNPTGVFFNEENIYSGLIKNGLFHKMANAYFIECPKRKDDFSDINHVTPVPPAPKPYKIGYYSSVIPLNDQGVLEHLKNLSNECEKLVVGIPNDVITARIFGDGVWPPAEQIKAQLESQSFVDHVEILGYEELLRQNIFNKVNYDITWYGSEYGFNLDSDKKFMQEKNIEFRSLIPERLGAQCEQDALKIALKNVQPKQKIILWGTGKYFDIYMDRYANKYKPVYAIDNNAEKWHTSKNGVQIYSPGILRQEDKENVLIVVCVKDWQNVVEFCDATFGHFNYRTMLYNNSIALLDEFGIAASQETKYLNKAQPVLLKMLKEFDRVCRENNIHYYGICGTLIGAVRHHGFIPWDDDVDVAIPRDDYERLKKIARKVWGKDNGEYLFVDYNELGNNTFLDCMPRLYYMKEHFPTKCFDKAEGKATADVGNRMLIDFYVMDNASNNEKRHMRYMNQMKVVYNFLMAKRAYIDYSEYDRLPKKTLRLMKTLHFIGKCIPFSVLIKWYEKLSHYAAKEKCDYYFMPSCAITCIERRFKKTFFEEGQDCKVEDMILKIPKDVEGLMEAMWYHNYMTPICESRRRPSHYFNSDITIW